MAAPENPLGKVIHFSWFPDPVVVADDLVAASAAIEDVSVPLELCIPEVANNIKSHFVDQGVPTGSWPPWAVAGVPGPAKPYQKDYTGNALMRLSGDTMERAGSPASYAVVGNNLEYIPGGMDELFHSSGPYLRNIWERPFVGLDEGGINECFATFRNWLIHIVQRASK